MALAVASRSGLLAAMLKDAAPHHAKHWASATRTWGHVPPSARETEKVLRSLVSERVVEQVIEEDGVVHFSIPSHRAPAVTEMGGIFEALLMHQRGLMDPVTTMNLVKFRCDKMLARLESAANTPTTMDSNIACGQDWGEAITQRQETAQLVNDLLNFVKFRVERDLGCTPSDR